MYSASNEWSSTGPFEALVLGKPTWPHVQVRRTWIIASAKLTSCHCKPRHSEMRRPVASSQKRQSAFRFSQVSDNGICLFGREDHGFIAAGRVAADKPHRVGLLASRDQAVSL